MKTILEEFEKSLGKNKILIKSHNEYHAISIERILFFEADGNYTKLHLFDGSRILISRSLSFFEKKLNYPAFIRCHHSFLVNTARIEKFNSKSKILTVSGKTIPISRRKLSKLFTFLKNTHCHL